jgi:hypothetical protein
VGRPGGHVFVETAKHKSGPYVNGLVEANLKATKSKSFYVKVTNQTSIEPVLVVMTQDSPDGSGYKQKYFRSGENITANVLDDGVDFTLKPGKTKAFRVLIQRRVLSATSFCSFTRFA